MAQEKHDYIEKMIKEDADSIEIDEEFKNNLKKRIIASNRPSVFEEHTSPKAISIWDRIKYHEKKQGEAIHLKAASILVSLLITGSIVAIFNNTGFQSLFAKNKGRDNLNSDKINAQVELKFNENDKNIALDSSNVVGKSKHNDKAINEYEKKSVNSQNETIVSDKTTIVVNNETKVIENKEVKDSREVKTFKEAKASNDKEIINANENPIVPKEEKPLIANVPEIETPKTVVSEIQNLNKNYATNGKITIQEFKIKAIKFGAEMPKAEVINSKKDNKTGEVKKSAETHNNMEVKSPSKVVDCSIKDGSIEDDALKEKQGSEGISLVRNSNGVFLYDANANKKYILEKSINISGKDKNDIYKKSEDIEKENKQLEIDFEKLFGEKTVYSFIDIHTDSTINTEKNEKEVYLIVINGENKKEEIIKLDTEVAESTENAELETRR